MPVKRMETYATLPASDVDRAKGWYAEKLGLSPSKEDEGGAWYSAGGNSFYLFKSFGKSSGDHTQVGWHTDDIDSEVSELKSKGVEFIEYDFPTLKTVNGIAEAGNGRAAWFKDSEGNLLGIFQRG